MVVGGFAISIPILFPLNIWLNNGMQGIGAYWGNIVSWPLDMDVARICVQKLIRRPFLFEERNRSRKQLPKANKRARDVGCYNLTIAFKKCKTQVYISIAIYIYNIYIYQHVFVLLLFSSQVILPISEHVAIILKFCFLQKNTPGTNALTSLVSFPMHRDA